MKRVFRLLRLAAFSAAAALAQPAFAAAGDLDLTFGYVKAGTPSGTVVLASFPTGSIVHDLTFQNDGKILAVGTAFPGFAIARFLPDGATDPAFGNAGRHVSSQGDTAYAVAVQPDGKFLVAGNATPFAEAAVVARYLPGGSPDPSFGGTGRVLPGIAGKLGLARGVSVLSDGGILVFGQAYTLNPSTTGTFIRRLLPDGNVDSAFGSAGAIQIPDIVAADLAVQPDGKIVLAGTTEPNDGSAGFWLGRWHAGGNPDTAFGNGGTLMSAPFSAAFSQAGSLALQSDGKIVVAGSAFSSAHNNYDFAVARFNPDGTPDASFNRTGQVLTDVSWPLIPNFDFARSVSLQSDGKLLVAGESAGSFVLVRYLIDGTIDAEFGSGGIAKTLIQPGGWGANTMAVQPDGKILLGGAAALSPQSRSNMALVRYRDRDLPPPVTVECPAETILKSGATLEMGSVIAGRMETREATILVRNTSAQPLSGLTAALTGIGAFSFAVLSPPSPEVAAGGVTTITVQFTSSPAVSSPDALLIIRGTQPGPWEFPVILHGSTDQPGARLALYESGSPVALDSTVDFGPSVAVPGATRIFTIRNTGNVDLTLHGVMVSDQITPGDFTAGPPQDTVLPPNTTTTFSVTFSPGGLDPRSARLRIFSTDTFAIEYDVTLTGLLADALEAWRQAHFGTGFDSGPGANLSDPDRDGLSNLLEYATLSDPNVPGGLPGRLVKIGNTLEYTITRPTGAEPSVTYFLEWRDSLQGLWDQTGVTTTILSDDGTKQEVKYSLSAGTRSRRFLRLRVTRY
ncbi:MAG TPA: choice-of-anchor D domain-containing protein [Verrucomicrobiales bacterium]|nr:choice-of-anchor D domain-containing protein [Verrucomicrobiales bacterium]